MLRVVDDWLERLSFVGCGFTLFVGSFFTFFIFFAFFFYFSFFCFLFVCFGLFCFVLFSGLSFWLLVYLFIRLPVCLCEGGLDPLCHGGRTSITI